jgi:hypothetical protein
MLTTEQSSLDTNTVTIRGVGIGTAWISQELCQKFVFERKNCIEIAIVFRLVCFALIFVCLYSLSHPASVF